MKAIDSLWVLWYTERNTSYGQTAGAYTSPHDAAEAAADLYGLEDRYRSLDAWQVAKSPRATPDCYRVKTDRIVIYIERTAVILGSAEKASARS